MERKLASVVRVVEVNPIEKADAIELVKIAGWRCVSKKNEFKVGDLGVYLEIDAVPPDSDVFRWLWTPKNHVGEAVPRPAKYRIRTMKLRGCLSQGLLLPFSQAGVEGPEGQDVTALLGVTKYEPPAPSGMGNQRGPFPSLIPKTDETRIQNAPGVLDELRGKPYVVTVKMDGTSATFTQVDGEFHACSRNFSITEGENLYWYVAKKYNLPEVLAQYPTYAIQGEVVGPGIQKNPLGLKDKDLYIFSVYDTGRAGYLSYDEAAAFCAKHDLQGVPVASSGTHFNETQESLLHMAEGKYEGTPNEREGIVIRPRQETFSEVLGGRLSFKAISNRYLLSERD